MNYDYILTQVGEFGFYHKRLFVWLLVLPIHIAFGALINLFLMLDVPFRCSVPGLANDTFLIQDQIHEQMVNASIPYDVESGAYSQCFHYAGDSLENIGNTTVACTSWVYDPDYALSSIIVDFDMVCDRRVLRAHFRMMSTVGTVLAPVFTGPIADSVGRKKPLIVFAVAMSVSLAIMAAFDSLPLLLTTVLASAAFAYACYFSLYTINVEIVGPSKRAVAGFVPLIGWSLGLYLLVPFYYFLTDWRAALYILAGTGIGISLLSIWIIPESPRWLLTRNRNDEAMKIFAAMAKVNKVKPIQALELACEIQVKEEEEAKPIAFPIKELWTLLKNKTTFLRIFFIAISWFSLSLAYTGTTFNLGEIIEGDIYVIFITQAAMESLGYILVFILLNRVPRRVLMFGLMVISGVSYLAIALLGFFDVGVGWLTVVLYATGKFGLSGGFNVMYILANEVVPTCVRNSAVGICTVVGNMGALVAPYLVVVDTVIPGAVGKNLPLLIFGVSCSISSAVCLLLPETRNRKLPDTVEEAKNFTRQTKPTLQ